MNTKLAVVCILCFFYGAIRAQTLSANLALNSTYIEAFGMGGYGSINYERLIFYHRKLHLAARLGVGTYRFRDFETRFNPDITVPFSFNAYYGDKHHAEIGVGQTFTSIVGASSVDFAVERKNNLSSNFIIGYRYQKNSGGVLFRLNYSPIISSTTPFKHWYGVSFGYSF